MISQKATVTIIIVNWNGKNFISDCLAGVTRQTFTDFSIVIVDNASDDGSVDLVKKQYPQVELVPLVSNLGFAAANNFAINSVNTEYIALLNPDTVPDDRWLARSLQALEDHPQIGSAASKMLLIDKSDIIDRAGDAYSISGTGLLRGRGESAHKYSQREWVFGSCAGASLYRRSMLKEIGLFDEDFFLLYEDVDLSFRAQLAGYRCIYVPDAVVYHMASASIGIDSAMSVYYSHRNLEWVYLKNMPKKLLGKTIWGHLVYDLASFLYFTIRGRGLSFLRAKVDALRGLRKALDKRKTIQSQKVVSDAYIWNLLTPERLYLRLQRRLRR